MAGPELKVCGLTRPEDAALCQELGIAYTGFIFAPESPRAVSPEAVAAMPRGRAKRVGVFTRMDSGGVRRVLETALLDYAQLHGGQDAAFCRAVGPERVIKVFWPEKQSAGELQADLHRFAESAAFFLFDAGTKGGGLGRAFDWGELGGLDIPRPWFLAGGIGPDTARAAAAYFPHALDVNSGVESAPGVKDAARLLALVNNLHLLQ